jgi:small redox-active disulfide protein 2
MAGRCSSARPQVSSVKFLGVGCEAMYEDALLAVKELGLDARVEYVTDMRKVHDYGVINIPGLAVNENVVSMGRVLNAKEIATFLR